MKYFSKIDAKQQYKLAVEELNRGRVNNAIELLDRAIDKYENHIPSLNLRGNVYASINKWEKTLKDFEKLYKLDSQTKKINLIIGNSHFYMRNYNKSIEFLSKHISLEPNYHVAYTQRAISYKNIGEIEKALIDIDKAIKIVPRISNLHIIKADILERLNRINDAEKTFDRAIEIEIQETTSFISFNHKMDFLERNERTLEAIDNLNKVLAENPYNRDLYFKRAEIYYSKGEYKMAEKDFEIALQYGLIEAKSKLKIIAKNVMKKG